MEQTVLRYLKVIGSWRDVADAARTTIRMGAGTKEPTSAWKRRILLAEHSPIRKLLVSWKWGNLPYWVSVHFVRHKYGIEHFVSTQRTDRTGEDRTVKQQDAPVEHECFANAAELMFISRRRVARDARRMEDGDRRARGEGAGTRLVLRARVRVPRVLSRIQELRLY